MSHPARALNATKPMIAATQPIHLHPRYEAVMKPPTKVANKGALRTFMEKIVRAKPRVRSLYISAKMAPTIVIDDPVFSRSDTACQNLSHLATEDGTYLISPDIKNMWQNCKWELIAMYGWPPPLEDINLSTMLGTSQRLWNTWRLDKCTISGLS